MAAAAPSAASTAPTPIVPSTSRVGSLVCARARRRSGAISGSHAARTSVAPILDVDLLPAVDAPLADADLRQAADALVDRRVRGEQVHQRCGPAAQRVH